MIAPARPRSLAVAAALAAAACVTVYEDAPFDDTGTATVPDYAVAQVIPLGQGGATEQDRLLLELYGGVLQRLHEAAAEDPPDIAGMFALLDAYEKPGLPEWLGDRLRGYRALGHGLAFLAHASARAELRLFDPASAPDAVEAPPVPAIGAPVDFEFVLPAGGGAVRLGGQSGADPIGFAIAITVEDRYVGGGVRSQSNQDFHWLDADFELGAGAVLRLPLRFDIPGGEAVRRDIHLRVDLLPGYVQIDGRRAPVQQRTLAATTLTQWPAGHEPIVLQPLLALREAIRLGDEAHFAHVFLGASFTTGADREVAIGLLVDQVRFGSPRQAVVAMATLRAITAADIQVGDREGWLAWSDLRR